MQNECPHSHSSFLYFPSLCPRTTGLAEVELLNPLHLFCLLLCLVQNLLHCPIAPMSISAVGFPLAIYLGFISSFLKANTLSIDYSKCATSANQTYWQAPNATFLYDQYGKPTDNVSRSWGISYQSCQAICGTPTNFDSYVWGLFSQGLTSWFLPWLALTAQLPFETKDKQTNFMYSFWRYLL